MSKAPAQESLEVACRLATTLGTTIEWATTAATDGYRRELVDRALLEHDALVVALHEHLEQLVRFGRDVADHLEHEPRPPAAARARARRSAPGLRAVAARITRRSV